MSALLVQSPTSIQAVVARARLQQLRGEWSAAFQQLPPLRRFPPPEKPGKQNAESAPGKQPAAAARLAYRTPPPPNSQPNDAFWTQPLGQHLDAFA